MICPLDMKKTSPVVLNHINLDIPTGVYLSVIGENGSCKTTLIKLILGLLSPNSGSITIDTKKYWLCSSKG